MSPFPPICVTTMNTSGYLKITAQTCIHYIPETKDLKADLTFISVASFAISNSTIVFYPPPIDHYQIKNIWSLVALESSDSPARPPFPIKRNFLKILLSLTGVFKDT